MEVPRFDNFMKEQQQGGPQVQQQGLPPEQQQVAPDRQVIDLTPQEGNMPVQQPSNVPAQSNPFATSQFSNVNLPDAPIQYGGGIAESLLNDNEVPKEVRKKFWHVFHKDNVLTFLDEPRKANKLLNFDITKIDMLNSMPYYNYTFEKEMEFNILRNVFETKLDRALGFKGQNVKNERIMLQSQFSEQRQISENGPNSMVKEGFFKRLLGRR